MSTDSLSYFWSLTSLSCPNWEQPASTPPPSLILLSGAVPNSNCSTSWLHYLKSSLSIPPGLPPLLSPSSPTLPSRFPAVLMFHRSPFQISIEAASRKLRSDGCTSPTKNHGQLQYILQTTREEKGQCKKYTNGTNSEGPRTKNKKKKTKQNNKTYSEIPITFPLSWRMSKKEEIWRK